MAIKGFADNPQQTVAPNLTDWLGIQQGTTLADMKKITYEDLMEPMQAQVDALDTAKADKDTDAVAGNFAYFDGLGNPVDSGHKDADYEDADPTILKQANIVDALNSTSTTAPLSANQGKVLNDAIDEVEGRVDETQSSLLTTKLAVNELERQAQIGNGATLDFSDIGIVPLDARATGRANPTVEGLTATNLVENGDFSQGTARWNGNNANILASAKILSATCTGTQAYGDAYQSIIHTITIGDKMYVFARVRVTNASCSSIAMRYSIASGSTAQVAIQSAPVQNQWYILMGVVTVPTGGASIQFWIRQSYADAATATGKVMEVDGNYGVTAINLTDTYGAGNEPTASDCAKIFSYFDGTKSIQLPARLRSVGRNLFDTTLPILANRGSCTKTIISDGMRITNASGTYARVGFKVSVVAGALYTLTRMATLISGTSSTPAFTAVADGLLTSSEVVGAFAQLGSNSGTGSKSVTFTAPDSRVIWVILHTSWDVDNSVTIDYTNIQLELGSTATPYEPYTDSTLYIADNEEVRSVPAISDEVLVENGTVKKVQNVQRYVLESDKITALDVYINVAVVRISNLGGYAGGGSSEINANNVLYGSYYFSGYADDVSKIGSFHYSSTGIVLVVSKTAYATLAEAQADLAGTTIYYQLATPIITTLTTSGTLKAFQNGSVYYEPYYEGSHQTNASSQITLPYEGTIDKLTGYDENLEPYEVPSTGYTLVGTTLTVTGAVENEVFYVEMSRSEPLAPEMTVNTLNNDQVTLDSADGKYYQIGFTTTNGVPTVTATEVL